MSYCRWSSDNWKCDLYCYFSVNNKFVTHVADNRIEGNIPIVPCILDVPGDEWAKAHRKQMDFLETAEHKKIGLPYDGMSFEDSTTEDFLERLNCLKEAGYNIPDDVIESVEEEISEGIP